MAHFRIFSMDLVSVDYYTVRRIGICLTHLRSVISSSMTSAKSPRRMPPNDILPSPSYPHNTLPVFGLSLTHINRNQDHSISVSCATYPEYATTSRYTLGRNHRISEIANHSVQLVLSRGSLYDGVPVPTNRVTRSSFIARNRTWKASAMT